MFNSESNLDVFLFNIWFLSLLKFLFFFLFEFLASGFSFFFLKFLYELLNVDNYTKFQ